jgi:protein-tyrosine phosphatase
MEYPHNLFPSLHIALCLIVADIHARHSRGLVRFLLCLWFLLIGISTWLTWQHHLVDLAGGAMLAAFACYVCREGNSHSAVTPNFRIGYYYTAGSVTALVLTKALGLWGVFLLWPVAALGIAAGAYFGFGPGIYRKDEGRLPWCARFVLAPILLGQFLSLLYYRLRCRAWDEVVPAVRMGRKLNKTEAAEAVKQGVTAVLDLTAEFSEASPFRGTRYLNLPILDLTAPTQDQLREAAAFIAEQAAEGTVYVHCKIGYSRSAAVVAAYLLASGKARWIDEAVELLRAARPSIVIRPEVVNALRTFACTEASSAGAN